MLSQGGGTGAQYIKYKSTSTFWLLWQPFFHYGRLQFLKAIEHVFKQ